MTFAELVPVGMFAGTLIGAAWFLWSRIQTTREAASADHRHLSEQLAAHRLHCAETYVSQVGLKDFRDEMVSNMRDVKSSVDSLRDRLLDQPRPPTARTRAVDRDR